MRAAKRKRRPRFDGGRSKRTRSSVIAARAMRSISRLRCGLSALFNGAPLVSKDWESACSSASSYLPISGVLVIGLTGEIAGFHAPAENPHRRSQNRPDPLAPNHVEQGERRSGWSPHVPFELRDIACRQVKVFRENGLAHVRPLS